MLCCVFPFWGAASLCSESPCSQLRVYERPEEMEQVGRGILPLIAEHRVHDTSKAVQMMPWASWSPRKLRGARRVFLRAFIRAVCQHCQRQSQYRENGSEGVRESVLWERGPGLGLAALEQVDALLRLMIISYPEYGGVPGGCQLCQTRKTDLALYQILSEWICPGPPSLQI